MLTPEELLSLVETMQPLIDELNEWITADLIKRLLARLERGGAFLTAGDDWQIQAYQEAGGHLEALQREIARWTKLADKEIQRIFEDAGIKALARDNAFYEARGLASTPLVQSEGMLRLLEDSCQRTAGTVHNFTRTTATASQQRFIRLLDKAHFLVSSGAASYTQVVEEVTKELVSEQTKVHYPSGHADTIETAVLRAVRTGVGQASGNMAVQGMIEHDWDIILVSAHLGARYGDGGENPGNHFWWQGKFYSRTGRTPGLPDFIKCTGYGTGEGLCGWNCRHSFGPGDGVFNPYKTYDSEENKKAYDLSQKQRAMEARIRCTKAKMAGLRVADMDEEYNKAARLLEKQNTVYQEFCRENNLKPLMERIQVAQWTREDARRAVMAAGSKSGLKKASPHATINDMEKQNVTREYLDAAAPGQGSVTYDADYAVELHQNEIHMAGWIHDTFGGDVRLLAEVNKQEVKTADFLWNNKLWDLKTVTTEKAANSAIRKGLQQIRENPGGIILDYRGYSIDIDMLSEVVEKRLKWHRDTSPIDIILITDSEVQVWRY